EYFCWLFYTGSWVF
nr:immunoglobulin light chain junction region [Macaca mulatta]